MAFEKKLRIFISPLSFFLKDNIHTWKTYINFKYSQTIYGTDNSFKKPIWTKLLFCEKNLYSELENP